MDTRLDKGPLAEINVTPFVDVMLVLLVIFMVTAPMLEQGVKVALPKAATGQKITQTIVSITVTKQQVVYLDSMPVTVRELRQKLTLLRGNRPVSIRVDRSVPVGKLMELWDLCRFIGFREVNIATLSE